LARCSGIGRKTETYANQQAQKEGASGMVLKPILRHGDAGHIPPQVQAVACKRPGNAVKHSPNRQEIAFLILGLLWFVLGIASLKGASSETAFLGRLAVQFVLLVAASVIILSWRARARQRSDHKPY